MELLVFRYAEWQQLYNCTGVLEQLEALYPIETRTYPTLAWTLIVLSTTYMALYVPCMVSIWQYVDNACYKFMFYTGVVDMAALCSVGYYHSFLSLNGIFFCESPIPIYFAGAFSITSWLCETTAELILGNRSWIWIAVITVYGLISFAFSAATVFIPMELSWLYNPYIGLRDDPNELFTNNFHISTHNFALVLAYPTFYVYFFIVLAIKVRETGRSMFANSTTVNVAQKMIFTQITVLTALNMFVALAYNYLELFRVPKLLLISAHFAWLHIHGLPPVIYLSLNKTIRSDCKGYLERMAKALKGNNAVTPVAKLLLGVRNSSVFLAFYGPIAISQNDTDDHFELVEGPEFGVGLDPNQVRAVPLLLEKAL